MGGLGRVGKWASGLRPDLVCMVDTGEAGKE